MGISNVEQLQALFHPHGVNQVYVKHLARNQDNDKNQIYLGRGIDGIAKILPPRVVQVRARSESKAKSRSEKGLRSPMQKNRFLSAVCAASEERVKAFLPGPKQADREPRVKGLKLSAAEEFPF